MEAKDQTFIGISLEPLLKIDKNSLIVDFSTFQELLGVPELSFVQFLRAGEGPIDYSRREPKCDDFLRLRCSILLKRSLFVNHEICCAA